MKTNRSRIPIVCAGITAAVACWALPLNAATTPNDAQPNTATQTQNSGLPYGVNEVVKLYHSGASKDVMIKFINSTAYPYHLSADDLAYLKSIGLPQDITDAMVARDKALMAAPVSPYAAIASEPGAAVPVTPSPDVTVIEAYPYYYDYPYWPVVVGPGWGWGGYWGWHGGFGPDRYHGGFHGGFGHGHR